MKQRRATFAKHVEAVRRIANVHLFKRASTANAIAKITTGHQRRLTYKIKDRALAQLIWPGRVLVGVDHDRYPGLLSVQLDRRHRLHTHENWLWQATRRAR